MNVCIFIGNLTADPELRYTPTGDPITQFSIAINERRGEKEETEFIDFACWDKLATSVAEYGRKGRKIAVQAQYHTERWTTEHGDKRSKVRMRARQVQFLDKPPEQVMQQARAVAEPEEDLSNLPF